MRSGSHKPMACAEANLGELLLEGCRYQWVAGLVDLDALLVLVPRETMERDAFYSLWSQGIVLVIYWVSWYEEDQ